MREFVKIREISVKKLKDKARCFKRKRIDSNKISKNQRNLRDIKTPISENH